MSENLFTRLQQANNKRSYPQTSSNSASTSNEASSDAANKATKKPKISRGGAAADIKSRLGAKTDDQTTTEDDMNEEEEEGECSDEVTNDEGDEDYTQNQNEDYDDDDYEDGDDADQDDNDNNEETEEADEQIETEAPKPASIEEKPQAKPNVFETQAKKAALQQKLQTKRGKQSCFNAETMTRFGLKIKDKRELLAYINKLKNKQAKNALERFEILEERDKIAKLVRYELEGNLISELKGTCMDMCPEKERYNRESLNLLKPYEIHQKSDGTIDHQYIIKQYSRSSADQDLPLPNELRPSETLMHTMHYLLREIFSQATQPQKSQTSDWIGEWYNFIWDRTRAIRKDITQQRLKDLTSIQIHEICARFHIYCAHRFCDQPPEVFDNKINEENLKNCFQSLIDFYNETAQSQNCANESEFRAYMILNNLNDGNTLMKTQRLRPQIRRSPEVQHALKIYFAFNARNYLKFFRLVEDERLKYLSACICHGYFAQIRIEALKTLASAFRVDKDWCYPLGKLMDILGFDNEADALFYCDQLGIAVSDSDANGERQVILNSVRKGMMVTKSVYQLLRMRRSLRLVESKLERVDRLSEIMLGAAGEVHVNIRRNLVPSFSFDASGNYVKSDLDELSEKIVKILNEEGAVGPFAQPVLAAENQPAPKNVFASIAKPADSLFKQKQTPSFAGFQDARTLFEPPKSSSMGAKPVFDAPKFTQAGSNLFSSVVGSAKLFGSNEPAGNNKQPVPIFGQTSSVVPGNLFTRIAEVPKRGLGVVQKPEVDLEMRKRVVDQFSEQEFLPKFIDEVVKGLVRSAAEDFVAELRIKNNAISAVFDGILMEADKLVAFTAREVLRDAKLDHYSGFFAELLCKEVVEMNFRRVLREIVSSEVNRMETDRFFDAYQHEIYDEIYLELFVGELKGCLKEKLLDCAEEFYENEILPSDIKEILRGFVMEDTKLMLNVNANLASDVDAAIEMNLMHYVLTKWRVKKALKMKRRSNLAKSLHLNRVELLKGNLFKMVKSEEFLLHLSWMRINYENILANLRIKLNNGAFKMLVVMPQICSGGNEDSELIKRWILSKFFSFDKEKSAYSTQYMKTLLTCFIKQHSIKFVAKLCDSDKVDGMDYEAKMTKRRFYGANSLVYILMPLGDAQLKDYLSENERKLMRVVKLVNENLTERAIINEIDILFISYLNNAKETENAIDHLLRNSTKSVKDVDYCVLDGQVVRDNQIIEETVAKFLLKTSQETPGDYSNLSPVSLGEAFKSSLHVFFDYLVKMNTNIPLRSILHEYNLRIDELKRFLLMHEFKRLSWPIPEHTDFTNAITAKYWNTAEVLDGCLQEFFKYMSLDASYFDELLKISSQMNYRLLSSDFDNIKKSVNKCINKLINMKNVNLDATSEQFTHLHSQLNEYLSRVEEERSHIRWQYIVYPIVIYLLSNGYLIFRSKKVTLYNFVTYCYFNELKSFDWINFNQIMETFEKLDTSDSNLSEKENKEAVITKETPVKSKQISPRLVLNVSVLNQVSEKSQADKELNDKFNAFFDLLNKEKSDSTTFESRLKGDRTELMSDKKRSMSNETLEMPLKYPKVFKADENEEYEDLEIYGILPKKAKAKSNYDTKALDDLLNALNEEKAQRENLDKKLEETLNDFY